MKREIIEFIQTCDEIAESNNAIPDTDEEMAENPLWTAPMTSGPIIPEHYARQWEEILARVEAGGNDGADIYEAEEFCSWLERRYGDSIQNLIDRLKTYIMLKMGKDFDPEKHCPYTGLALHQFPMLGGPGNSDPLASASMGYWREDGELMRCRRLTEEEQAWITGNPDAFTIERAEFEAWLRPFQDASELAYQERVKKLVDGVK